MNGEDRLCIFNDPLWIPGNASHKMIVCAVASAQGLGQNTALQFAILPYKCLPTHRHTANRTALCAELRPPKISLHPVFAIGMAPK